MQRLKRNCAGTIETGKLADFTILSADIMKIPEPEILKTRCVMTVINGEIVYEHKSSQVNIGTQVTRLPRLKVARRCIWIRSVILCNRSTNMKSRRDFLSLAGKGLGLAALRPASASLLKEVEAAIAQCRASDAGTGGDG